MVKQRPKSKKATRVEQKNQLGELKEKLPFSSVSYSVTLDNGLIATNPQDIRRLQSYSLSWRTKRETSLFRLDMKNKTLLEKEIEKILFVYFEEYWHASDPNMQHSGKEDLEDIVKEIIKKVITRYEKGL